MDPKRRRPRTQSQPHTHTHTCLQNWDSGGVYNFKLYTNGKRKKKKDTKPASKLLNYLIANTRSHKKSKNKTQKKANQQNLMKLSCVYNFKRKNIYI